MIKRNVLNILTITIALLILSQNTFATLSAVTDYDTLDVTMDTATGKSYSGGIDIVYSQVASGTAASKTRSFLKCEDGEWTTDNWGVRVNLYSYLGDSVSTFATVNPYGSAQYSIFCQGVKVDPIPLPTGDRRIWFSMTGSGSSEGDWYSVVVDSDFANIVTPASQEFSQAGNWEVEWSTDPVIGNIPFFAGKETDAWNDPHAIYIRSGSLLQKVVDVQGYSCGFAFDNDGNLYTGTYNSSGPSDQQYVRLYSAAQIQAAVSSGIALTPAQAISSIPVPMAGASGNIFLGVNDLESDPDGNIYVTANGAWSSQYNSDLGFVFKIDACTDVNTPPATMAELASGTLDPNNSDWQKGLVYDGESNLAAGGHYNPTLPSITGNRLYVDQDFSWGSGGPDVVSAVGKETDSDSDTVPDCLDNAYLTSNPGQTDADLDMYGNISDADFDNNGVCLRNDYYILRGSMGTSNPVTDMNSDGIVDRADEALLISRALTVAPFY